MDYLTKYGLEPHACKTVSPGDRFGRITILAVGKLPGGGYRYRAVYRCDCGSERCVQIGSIQIGTTKSCGCGSADRVRTHGMWGTPIMNTWRLMMSRCYDPESEKFGDYGGRGISVCERWHDVVKFNADMAPTYAPGLTLDRLNNEGPYSPSNCRWATPAEQSRNKRNNINVTIGDRTMILRDWCREHGVSYSCVYYRVKEMGWEPLRALTTPNTRPRRLV